MTKNKKPAPRNSDRTITNIPLDLIVPPKIPARTSLPDGYIETLALSIKNNGLLQPISVKKKGRKYEIVFGHCRYLAHKHLNKPTIPAEIHTWQDARILLMRATENHYRENLNPMDEARYLDAVAQELNITNTKLAKELGVSEAYVSQRRAVISYDKILQDALSAGDINFSVARQLNRLTDDNYRQLYLRDAIDNGATPAVVQRWVDDHLKYQNWNPQTTTPQPAAPDPEQHLNPGQKCYICDQYLEYKDLKSVWICKHDLQTAIDLIVREAEKQLSKGDPVPQE